MVTFAGDAGGVKVMALGNPQAVQAEAVEAVRVQVGAAEAVRVQAGVVEARSSRLEVPEAAQGVRKLVSARSPPASTHCSPPDPPVWMSAGSPAGQERPAEGRPGRAASRCVRWATPAGGLSKNPVPVFVWAFLS